MTPEEFKGLTGKILTNLSDQATVSEALMQLNEVYTQQHTDKANLNTKIDEYEVQVKNLQNTNMNLFLKVANPTPQEQINTPEEVSYDDLLNDWKV